MSQLDTTAATAALKQRFASDAMKFLGYADHPFLMAVKKNTDAFGENMKFPVRVANAQGRSADLGTARDNVYAMNLKAFEITPNEYYAVSQITGKVVATVKGNQNAFEDLVGLSLSDLLMSHGGDISGQLFRDGSGSIGQILSHSDGVLTLTDADDVTQFDVGQVLQARTGTNTPETALGYVIRVDRSAGTVTVAASGQGGVSAFPTLWADNDYLLLEGNADLTISGLAAWIPDTVGTSDNFFGVNRSIDRTRLAGVVYDGTGQTIKQAIINGTNLIAREGGRPDAAYCSFDTVAALISELNAQVQQTNPGPGTPGVVPFDGVEIYCARGKVKVIPDSSCPSGVIYVLTMRSWSLLSAGGAAPHVDDFGQGVWMRMSDQDSYELRTKSYANLSCNAPGHNGKILVTVS
jgi:hypothetical protein